MRSPAMLGTGIGLLTSGTVAVAITAPPRAPPECAILEPMTRALRTWIIPAISMVAAGCGTAPAHDDVTRDATADAPTDVDGGPDFVPRVDAASPPAPRRIDAGAPFLCGDCLCEGADHYCVVYQHAGGAPPPMPLDADGGVALCPSPDAGVTSCYDLPPECLQDLSCDCMDNHHSGICEVDPSGDGLDVIVPVP